MDNPGKLATKIEDEGKQKKNTTQYKTNKHALLSIKTPTMNSMINKNHSI